MSDMACRDGPSPSSNIVITGRRTRKSDECKILENHWDTHSGVSPMAMQGILQLAKAFGMKPSLLKKCKDATTVEAIIQQFSDTPKSFQFWQLVEQRINEKVQSRLQHVLEVRTLLFDMHRNPLGLSLIQSCE